MKRLKVPIALLLLLAVVLICPFGTVASEPEAVQEVQSPVTIQWVWGETSNGGGGGGGTNSGGGNGGSNLRSSSSGFTIRDGDIPLDTVTILDPDVPLADLGELPKTGGDTLIPLLLCAAGAMPLMAGRSCSGGKRADAALA